MIGTEDQGLSLRHCLEMLRHRREVFEGDHKGLPHLKTCREKGHQTGVRSGHHCAVQ